MSHLFTPYTLRGITFRNRIFVSPMCQYSSNDGLPNDWHLVHLGSRAVGGAGLVMVEASGVSPEGRITAWDSGIWSQQHADAFRRIATFVESNGAVSGIQLAHAGRKASTDVPWRGGHVIHKGPHSWQAVAPWRGTTGTTRTPSDACAPGNWQPSTRGWPESTKHLRTRTDLRESSRAKIAGTNAARFYGLA